MIDTSSLSLSNAAQLARKYTSWALGAGTPTEQLIATTVIGVAVLVSSTVSLGTTLILLPIVIFWFFVGVLRFIPAVNKRWPVG